MKKFFLLILILPCFSYALSFSELKSSLRDKLSPYLSKELVGKIFGEKPTKNEFSYDLPLIPKLEDSATDISIYKKKEISSKVTSFDSLSDIEKQKYRVSFLKELFFEVSRKKITSAQLSTYVDRFNQGVSREGIYRSIVSGREYYELEQNPSIASEKLVEFTLNFGKNYLNTSFKENSLRNSNKYVIKRNLTDKTLSLVEYFSAKPESLYKWYAIISSEFANYSGWKNKFRSSKSQKFHYEWAKKSPLSHLKSELIIKIHKLCNYL